MHVAIGSGFRNQCPYARLGRWLTITQSCRAPSIHSKRTIRVGVVTSTIAPGARNESVENDSAALLAEPDQSPLFESWWTRRPVWIAVSLVVAALCAGAYAFWSAHRATSLASRAPANRPTTSAVLATKDGDLPPGIDGGPMDADQSYVFRRQPTFYRTLQPVGSVIVDKLQHFLYFVQWTYTVA